MSKNVLFIESKNNSFTEIVNQLKPVEVHIHRFTQEAFETAFQDLYETSKYYIILFDQESLSETLNALIRKDYSFENTALVHLVHHVGDTILEKEHQVFNINFKNELPFDLQINYMEVFLSLIFDKMEVNHRINDYIIKSFELNVDNEVIKQQKEKIEKLYYALESISKIDHLTNVLNKKAFYESLETEKKRTLRDLWKIKEIKTEFISEESLSEKKIRPEDYFGAFTCLMMDIDHFKKINDTYGHLSGDEVLKKIGEILTSKQIFRETDIIGRFGGEEFIIILPDTTIESALIPAERLRKRVQDVVFTDSHGVKFQITVSIGLSQFNINDKTSNDLIERADKALYYSKNHGRNRTTVYEAVFPGGLNDV